MKEIDAAIEALEAAEDQLAKPYSTMVRNALAGLRSLKEHDLQDVRCACCGYMTYHREHISCIRAAHTHPAPTTLEPVNKTLLEALKYLLGPSHDENVGWRGIHGTETVFECEFCGERHEDCALIAHLDNCPVVKARTAIAAAEQAPQPKAEQQRPVAWSVFDKRTGKHWYTNESKFTSQHYANEYSHREGDGSPSMKVVPLYTHPAPEAKQEPCGYDESTGNCTSNPCCRKALEAELQEQARVNGMGGEREAALMAQIQELKGNLEKKSVAIQRIWKERDELRKVNWAAYEIGSLEFDYKPQHRSKNTLSCGCRSEYLGFPAVWDVDGGTEHGAICEKHFYQWQARPEGGV